MRRASLGEKAIFVAVAVAAAGFLVVVACLRGEGHKAPQAVVFFGVCLIVFACIRAWCSLDHPDDSTVHPLLRSFARLAAVLFVVSALLAGDTIGTMVGNLIVQTPAQKDAARKLQAIASQMDTVERSISQDLASLRDRNARLEQEVDALLAVAGRLASVGSEGSPYIERARLLAEWSGRPEDYPAYHERWGSIQGGDADELLRLVERDPVAMTLLLGMDVREVTGPDDPRVQVLCGREPLTESVDVHGRARTAIRSGSDLRDTLNATFRPAERHENEPPGMRFQPRDPP